MILFYYYYYYLLLHTDTLLEKLSLFDALHSCTLCAGDQVVNLEARNMTIFDLAPSPAELARFAASKSDTLDPFDVFIHAQVKTTDDEDDDQDDKEVTDADEWRGDSMWHQIEVVPPTVTSSIANAPPYNVSNKVCF